LLDDDIVSLTALTLIVINPACRAHARYMDASQLTLSLYLMTQYELKRRHSVTSLAQTLDYVEVAQKRREVQPQPFYGPFPGPLGLAGATIKFLDYGARED